MHYLSTLVIALAAGQAISAAVPSLLDIRADPAAVTCTTDGKNTDYTKEDVSNAYDKFGDLINGDPADWPTGPGKRAAKYPSRNKLAKATPTTLKAIEKECPIQTTDEQWWEFPLVEGTYTGGNPGFARIIARVTDNGKGAKGDQYTDLKYCGSVAYVKDDKAQLGLCT